MEEYIIYFNRKWGSDYPLNLKAIVKDERRITRCKDCKYYDTDVEYNSYLCKYFRAYCTPEDYCSNGKRKEGEE